MMESLLLLEQELTFSSFDRELAWQIGSELANQAITEHLPIVIDITIVNQQVFHYSAPAALPGSDLWVIRKHNTVMFFAHSSVWVLEKINGDQQVLSSKYGLDLKDHVAASGGFPILVKGVGLIGSLCVSGLSGNQDQELIVAVLRKHLR